MSSALAVLSLTLSSAPAQAAGKAVAVLEEGTDETRARALLVTLGSPYLTLVPAQELLGLVTVIEAPREVCASTLARATWDARVAQAVEEQRRGDALEAMRVLGAALDDTACLEEAPDRATLTTLAVSLVEATWAALDAGASADEVGPVEAWGLAIAWAVGDGLARPDGVDQGTWDRVWEHARSERVAVAVGGAYGADVRWDGEARGSRFETVSGPHLISFGQGSHVWARSTEGAALVWATPGEDLDLEARLDELGATGESTPALLAITAALSQGRDAYLVTEHEGRIVVWDEERGRLVERAADPPEVAEPPHKGSERWDNTFGPAITSVGEINRLATGGFLTTRYALKPTLLLTGTITLGAITAGSGYPEQGVVPLLLGARVRTKDQWLEAGLEAGETIPVRLPGVGLLTTGLVTVSLGIPPATRVGARFELFVGRMGGDWANGLRVGLDLR